MVIADLKDANWEWCSLCCVPILKCMSEDCRATTCNAAGCAKCLPLFQFVIAQYYGDNPPLWFKEMSEKFEKQYQDQPEKGIFD